MTPPPSEISTPARPVAETAHVRRRLQAASKPAEAAARIIPGVPPTAPRTGAVMVAGDTSVTGRNKRHNLWKLLKWYTCGWCVVMIWIHNTVEVTAFLSFIHDEFDFFFYVKNYYQCFKKWSGSADRGVGWSATECPKLFNYRLISILLYTPFVRRLKLSSCKSILLTVYRLNPPSCV